MEATERTARRVVLVTGGNRGIGREVCRQLAAAGHRVILSARSRAKAEEAAGETGIDTDRVIPLELDVTDPGQARRAAGRVRDQAGGLDVLVNNAGIDYDTDQDVLTADLDRARRVLETNTLGAWRMAQVFLPLLRESDHPRIVNVSSQSGALSSQTGSAPAYSLSKAALNALTLQLASRLEGEEILVNAVCPGWVRTEMGGPGAPRSVEEGAASVIWAVTLPDDGPTGGFFRDGERLEW